MFSTLFHGTHSVFRMGPQWKVEWNVGGFWKVGCDMWNVTCGMWSVACGMWRVACGMWKVVSRMWNVECRMSKVECRMECGMWNVACGMWHVKAVQPPACSLLMSVVIAGYTTHTVNNVRASYHSQLYMYSRSSPSQRWKAPTLDRPSPHAGGSSCNFATTLVSVLNGW